MIISKKRPIWFENLLLIIRWSSIFIDFFNGFFNRNFTFYFVLLHRMDWSKRRNRNIPTRISLNASQLVYFMGFILNWFFQNSTCLLIDLNSFSNRFSESLYRTNRTIWRKSLARWTHLIEREAADHFLSKNDPFFAMDSKCLQKQVIISSQRYYSQVSESNRFGNRGKIKIEHCYSFDSV